MEQAKELQVHRDVSPASLIQTAIEKGVDIAQLQQLMELKERHEANEARKAFNEAMSGFRENCPAIARTRKGHNTKYAGLSETIDQIKPLLSQFGLSHQWKTSQEGGAITVQCIVTHRLGHSESTSLTAEPDTSGNKNSIQAIGSTVAYLERYTLYAVLGLSSREMDDDGYAAAGVETIDEEQAANIDALLAEVNGNVQSFLTYYKIPTIHSLPASKYTHAVKSLEAKRGK